MAVRLTNDWVPVDDILAQLKGNLGVFEAANAASEVVFIGFAGGRSRFGLKGEVAAALETLEAQATQKTNDAIAFVRVEVTTSYHTRYRELLMAHVADHGGLPEFNEPINLGRLSPA